MGDYWNQNFVDSLVTKNSLWSFMKHKKLLFNREKYIWTTKYFRNHVTKKNMGFP